MCSDVTDITARRLNVVAIIPACTGAKADLGQNMYLLGSTPLLAHTIEHARQTRSVNRVVVSTDDPQIADLAGQYGAEVVWRPAEISGDEATSESVLLHALNYLRDTEGYEPDLVVSLQAASPLHQPADIQNAIETLQREQADSLFSACPVRGSIWRSTPGGLTPLDHVTVAQVPNEVVLEENGSIYMFKPWVLRKYNRRLGGKITTYRMRWLDSFPVEEPGDLVLVERLLSTKPAHPGKLDLSRVKLLILDFDGVMTDNRVLVNQDGIEAVWCNRGDGWGIAWLKKAGVEVIVLSTETNPVVAVRSRKLGVECVQGRKDKLPALQALVQQHSLGPEQVAYVGNDVNDLACMRWVGVPIAVADAMPGVRAVSRLITTHAGGRGAVREIAGWILDSQARRKGG